ncbi:MAG: methyltransferase domain-containing protein [Pseudomonadota bacterium]
MTACSICGGQTFVPAFHGRLYRGQPPKCATCGSFERHRAVHGVFTQVQQEFEGFRALHFAPDASVNPKWFARYQPSTYGSGTSLDMMATGLGDETFDLVVSNHVLEHVSDDVAAIREQLRILTHEGWVHFTVPLPMSWAETDDWGYPKADSNDHYRGYGADMAGRLVRAIPEMTLAAILGTDPVTGRHEWMFWVSRSRRRMVSLTQQLLDRKVPVLLL